MQESKASVLNIINSVGVFLEAGSTASIRFAHMFYKQLHMGIMKTNIAELHRARSEHQPSLTEAVPYGLAVRGPEVREQHQTQRPSETGLELYASSDYTIFICSFLKEHGT